MSRKVKVYKVGRLWVVYCPCCDAEGCADEFAQALGSASLHAGWHS